MPGANFPRDAVPADLCCPSVSYSSSSSLREARGGTRGWFLRAPAFTWTPVHGGAGGGGQGIGRGRLDGTGEGRLGADSHIPGGQALRPEPADPGWRPTHHPPSHRLSSGAQSHTPFWGSKWSLPGGRPCCSNKAGGAVAWGVADAAGSVRDPGASRAQPLGRRGGGEPEPEPEPEPEQEPVLAESTRAQPKPEPQPRWPWPWGDRL